MKLRNLLPIGFAVCLFAFASCSAETETITPQPQDEETRAAAINNVIKVTWEHRRDHTSGGGYVYHYDYDDMTFTATYPVASDLVIRLDITKSYWLDNDTEYWYYDDYVRIPKGQKTATYTFETYHHVNGPGVTDKDRQSWTQEITGYRFRTATGSYTTTLNDGTYIYSVREW